MAPEISLSKQRPADYVHTHHVDNMLSKLEAQTRERAAGAPHLGSRRRVMIEGLPREALAVLINGVCPNSHADEIHQQDRRRMSAIPA